MVPAIFQEAAYGVGLLESSDDTNMVITLETLARTMSKS